MPFKFIRELAYVVQPEFALWNILSYTRVASLELQQIMQLSKYQLINPENVDTLLTRIHYKVVV